MNTSMANSLLWISREYMATLSPTPTAYVTIHYINAFSVNSHFTYYNVTPIIIWLYAGLIHLIKYVFVNFVKDFTTVISSRCLTVVITKHCMLASSGYSHKHTHARHKYLKYNYVLERISGESSGPGDPC